MLGVADDYVWTSDRNGDVTRHEFLPEPAGGAYGALYKQMLKAINGEEHYPTIIHGARDVRVALAAYASPKRQGAVDVK